MPSGGRVRWAMTGCAVPIMRGQWETTNWTCSMAGKPTRHDGPSGRYYEVEGRRLHSVTHILSCLSKPALVNWSANMERAAVMEAAADLYEQMCKAPDGWTASTWPRAVYLSTLQSELGKVKAHTKALAAAGDIGTQIHGEIERRTRVMMGLSPQPAQFLPDPAIWAVLAWEDWAKAVDLQPIRAEQMVFSLQHGYAGTMDLLARVEGVETLVDYKSSKSVYPESHLQTTAYRWALVEMGLVKKLVPALIVRLPKNTDDPAFEVVPSPPAEELMPTFLAVLETWRWWRAAEDAGRAAYQARKAAG